MSCREGRVVICSPSLPLQVPPALAVEPPSAATSSPLGCVLERSRRLCLNLYRKEMLTADSAVESALK